MSDLSSRAMEVVEQMLRCIRGHDLMPTTVEIERLAGRRDSKGSWARPALVELETAGLVHRAGSTPRWHFTEEGEERFVATDPVISKTVRRFGS